ncbi:MAG: hypothetical protein LBN43_05185 [Oscillospiraceae bacterium]|nr:hypothetical protein [Oscillospiraceae bacterium]
MAKRGEHLITHGTSGTRLYRIWCQIKTRCFNAKYIESQYYSKRGITMCAEWRDDYVVFRDWALSHGYTDNLSIDRVDNNGDYSPQNCRWATDYEQSRNRRQCKYIYNNGEKFTVSEIAKMIDVNPQTAMNWYKQLGVRTLEEFQAKRTAMRKSPKEVRLKNKLNKNRAENTTGGITFEASVQQAKDDLGGV